MKVNSSFSFLFNLSPPNWRKCSPQMEQVFGASVFFTATSPARDVASTNSYKLRNVLTQHTNHRRDVGENRKNEMMMGSLDAVLNLPARRTAPIVSRF